MKSLFMLAMLFCNVAYGASLDQVLSKINQDLNPKTIDGIGYQVEYREERNGYVWINIERIQYRCETKMLKYVEKDEIVSKSDYRCELHVPRLQSIFGESLWQVMCADVNGDACKALLAKEVTTDIIHKIVSQSEDSLYVRKAK